MAPALFLCGVVSKGLSEYRLLKSSAWVLVICARQAVRKVCLFSCKTGSNFWCRPVSYVVVVEYILPDYALITGFCVDAENQAYFQNKYIHRVK